MTKRVGTIRDVAAATGLSTATVSRVMNRASNVTPQTRARVLEACEDLNYLPNPAARALSTNRSRTIAAIIPTIEHSIFAKFITAVEQTLSEQGYTLVLSIADVGGTGEVDAARKLLGMGAEAFILSGGDHSDDLYGLLAGRRTPYILTSTWEPDSNGPVIGYDNAALAAQAVHFIAEKGHRRIAAIHGPLSNNDRTRARRRGAEASGGEDLEIQFFETSLDVAGGRGAMARVLDRQNPPFTAALCFSDVLALGAYFELSAAGLQIPSDMSIMGFDNLDWSAFAVPGLTTINLPVRRMGAGVASQLMAHLGHGTEITPTELFGDIIDRGSVAALS